MTDTPTEAPAAVGDEIEKEAVAYVKREHVATRSGACTFCPREDWPCRAYRLAIAVEESARLVQRKVLEAQLKLHNEICPFVEPCGRYEDLAAGLAALEER